MRLSREGFTAYIIFMAVMTLLFIILIPDRDMLSSYSLSRVVYDSRGNILRLSMTDDESFRLRVTKSELSPLVKEAILFQEDRYFHFHFGVNPISLVRAFYESYIRKSRLIGASTITMQLARLYYNLNTRTIGGKLNQIVRAMYLDFFYTKEQILRTYLTLVPCGGNIEGFASASIIYFGKALENLNIDEILMLSVIPQSPAVRTPDPSGPNMELLAARNRLFDRWILTHPDDLQYEPIFSLPLDLSVKLPFSVPHFTTDLLQDDIDAERIFSTIDPDMQELVEKHVQLYGDRNREKGVRNASVLVVNTESMKVLASLGSMDFFNDDIDGQVNGTRARRSPGSTLKPFVYGLALDQGLIQPMTMLKDAPTSFSEYTPDNFRSEFKGAISATEALTSSRNIPAVRLASKLKNPDLYDLLKTVGIPLKNKEHYGLSIVLGSAEITMEELVFLYSGLVNNGNLYSLNKTNHIDSTRKGTLFSPEAAFLVKNMLESNPRPDRSDSDSEPVAYKTGTSIGFKDCWSISIFDNLIVGVWIGNFNGEGNHSFLGRYMAAPLMFEIIDSIRRSSFSKQREDLHNSLNLVQRSVCAVSGLLPNENCKDLVSTYFIPGVSSIESCKIHREIYIDPETGFRVHEESDKTESLVWEFWPSDLLNLFREAGFPRKLPPPFDPDSDEEFFLLNEGYIPEIESPQSNIEYVLRLNSSAHTQIPLKASVDGDVENIYWFAGNRYIGSAQGGETIFWDIEPGDITIRVVDDKGRSNYRDIRVIMAE